MKYKVLHLLSLVLIGFSVGSIDVRADDPPTWFKQAASLQSPSYEKDVPAVVLHNEQQVTLNDEGKIVSTQNYAIRLINRDGRSLAMARAYYLASASKIRDISGWIMRPDGSFKEYEKKTVVDIISDPDDVYNEGRLKVIDATRDVDTGYVFGYSVTTEETPLFFQDRWEFQDRLPVLVSRYSLNLPTGWTASSITFNTAELKPQVNGSSYTWEVRGLAPIPPEPMSPSVMNLSPRIVVNYTPDAKSMGPNKTFATWADVSRWATALHEPQVVIDDDVAAKARELTANAKTELEQIRAIGTFVQNLQYISIDIGVAFGNGYKPRSSSLVLARGYGDCKDKANLMRAMLRSLKIEAYPIAIFSGDATFVRAEWPSPGQFNHCIIAVKVSDATNAPSVMKHETLGRLLIFDATDPYTPVGDLPEEQQGSLALIAAGDKGGLSPMPTTSIEGSMLDRRIEATIGANGEIKGSIAERASGGTSSMFRREARELSASDYKKALEGWLTRGATGAQLLKVEQNDRLAESGFDLNVDFSAAKYAQIMQGRLFIFKPVLVGRRDELAFTDEKRKAPVEIGPTALKETAVFNLPDGFAVDEVPDAVQLSTPFGEYTTKYEVKGEQLIFTRMLKTKRATIAVDKYPSVREFFSKIRDAEQSPVVLLKK